MDRKLVVTQAFGDYQVGAEITDAETVKAVEASHPAHVVAAAPVTDPETPAAPTPAARK